MSVMNIQDKHSFVAHARAHNVIDYIIVITHDSIHETTHVHVVTLDVHKSRAPCGCGDRICELFAISKVIQENGSLT
jgi:hypothetical protein